MIASTELASGLAGDASRGARSGSSSIRLAVIDADTGFLQVLIKRLDGVGWQYRVLASPVPPDAVVAMRLNAIVIDLALLGAPGWDYLERLCSSMPGLGVVVCTGQSTVAQRVRGLRLGADDWLTKPCHPEELIARVESVVRRRQRAEARVDAPPARRRRARDPRRPVPGLRRRPQPRPHAARVRADPAARRRGRQVLEREEIYQRVWGYAMAHGDRSVDVFVRKLRQKLERASPRWRYIHTHFGIGYRFAPEPLEADTGAPLADGPAAPNRDPAVAPAPARGAGDRELV